MRITDYIEQSLSNLWKKKLRTFLTTFGIVIGIGALVSMISFGQGIQKNVSEKFKELELFNYINVFVASQKSQTDPDQELSAEDEYLAPQFIGGSETNILDDTFLREVTQLKGVETAFPEIRFPAMVRFNQQERFTLIQALPAEICNSSLAQLKAGDPYQSDDENFLIISDHLLRDMKCEDPKQAIGQKIQLSTLTFGLDFFNPASIIAILQGRALPFSRRDYTFTIVGVAEREGIGGPMPIRSDVFIPIGASEKMKKISLTSIGDFFHSAEKTKGYPMISVKLTSAKYVDPVKKQIQDMGFQTFALIDQLQEFKTGFILMDMFLFAVGMIGISVACLGIVNTMVMSILERYREIGIIKAIGATNKDVKKIFFFEAGVIGFLGGIFGFILGWAVSMIINQVINYFLSRQGVPYIDYFSFPWWLFVGAVVFSILVSLAAGIYPTMRAAHVDPVVALRHD